MDLWVTYSACRWGCKGSNSIIHYHYIYKILLNVFGNIYTLFLVIIKSPISDISDKLGPNDLPYKIPIHPNLVHLTIGLFAIGIAFDISGAFYPF